MKPLIIFCCLVVFSAVHPASAQSRPKPGDKAPDFTATDQDGKEVSLSDYRGKKVILYFYPKDMSSGCTAEACNLRDNMEDIQKEGYEVLGVSADSEASHKQFADKYSLPFRLVADTDKSINKKYGVWGEREYKGMKFQGTARTTFIIDEKGIITRVIDHVETADHAAQILKL